MPYDPNLMNEDTTLDPLQGMDIKVSTYSAATATGRVGGVLVGAFTSAMFKIVNQTETYLPLNERIARQLDGEIIIVYALEQGLVSPNVMSNTFGRSFADALGSGRGTKIPRSSRFNVKMEAELSQDLIGGQPDPAIYNNSQIADAGTVELEFHLLMCRVDTYSFGMTAGRHVVANSWQGTAEGLKIVRALDGTSSTGTAT